MDYIKLYEEYFWENQEKKAIKFLRKNNIYCQYVNGCIECQGSADLSHKILHKIPFKFTDVQGGFDCSYNYLTNLKNSPDTVVGTFNCSHNFITKLVECPKSVGSINLSFNKLKSFDCFPEVVRGACDISNNKLRTLDGLTPFCDIDNLTIFPNKYLPQSEVDKYMERRMIDNQEGSPYKKIRKWVSKEFHNKKGDYYEKLEDFEIFFDEDEK